MTQVKASSKWNRTSALKLRRILNLIRRKPAGVALTLLKFMPHKAARIIEKVIKSAVANAKHNYKMNPDKLIIAQLFADGATIMRRIRPRARGRAFPIKKRSAHVTVYLEEAK